MGPRFRVGRLSRNGSKLVDSLEVEEGTRCSRRVAPLRRGNGEVDRIRCLLCLNEDGLRAPARSCMALPEATLSSIRNRTSTRRLFHLSDSRRER